MSRDTLDQRVSTLESRVGEIEVEHSETTYRLHRDLIRNQITLAELAAKFGVQLASEAAVDKVFEDRS